MRPHKLIANGYGIRDRQLTQRIWQIIGWLLLYAALLAGSYLFVEYVANPRIDSWLAGGVTRW